MKKAELPAPLLIRKVMFPFTNRCTAYFAKLGKLKHLIPTAPEAQAAIRDLQQFITDHFYTCTPEILAGLGQMYVADDRFRKNIDMAGGEGTAAFVAQAIAAYCGK